MEAVILKAKENITEVYGLKPVSAYDIEGILVQKEGKNAKIEKSISDEKVYFFIRLKDEIKAEIGQKVRINGDNILSYRIYKHKKELNVAVDRIIENLGLENSNEIKEALMYFMENKIAITRENIETFLTSKGYLKEIVNRLDLNTIASLLDMGIDIMEEPLHKIVEALSREQGDKSQSIKGLLETDRALTYKEAEKIAMDIYRRKMGKDVYEAIIALSNGKVPVNKENVERILEVVNKLYDLKNSNDQVFVKILNKDITVNIENLYRVKHSYKFGRLNKNIASPIYESFTVEKEPEYEDIVRILGELNIETTNDNINLAREFLLNEVQITDTDFKKALHIKNTLKQLTDLLNKENIARLMNEGIDPMKEDIFHLVECLKAYEDKLVDMDQWDMENILKSVEKYREITDKDLVFLIKSHEDFKLENISRIIDTQMELSDGMTRKALDKTISIINIINTLGDLDENVISLASRRYSNITLNNLYKSSLELKEKTMVETEPVDNKTAVLIRQEYYNIRENITIRLIKYSIEDNISMENMPLKELNEYIYSKNNVHEETERIFNDIKNVKGREEYSVLAVMKNNSDMCLGEIIKANSALGSSAYFYSDDKNERNKKSKAFKTAKKKSKDDIALQIPVDLGDEISNLNLIMPDMKKGFDRENMNLYLSIKTRKLGNMEFSFCVKKNIIYLDFEAPRDQIILDNISLLKEKFSNIGYGLVILKQKR